MNGQTLGMVIISALYTFGALCFLALLWWALHLDPELPTETDQTKSEGNGSGGSPFQPTPQQPRGGHPKFLEHSQVPGQRLRAHSDKVTRHPFQRRQARDNKREKVA